MNEDKGAGADEQDFAIDEGHEEKRKSHSASRARNRTVMLTPEMTGQVRALLHQEPSEQKPTDALEDFLPPLVDWNSTAGQQPEESGNGLEDGKTGRSTAKFKREHINEAMEAERSLEPPVYDPMTMVAPPVKRPAPQPVRPMPSEAPQAAARPGPAQPVFSVNAPVSSSQPVVGRGAAVRPGPAPAAPVSTGPARMVGKSKIVAFLISFDEDKNGEVYEIRSGRWLLTSRPTDHGEYILIDDETISPLHAIIRATKDGKLQVLDQLSEFGTSVFRSGTGEEIEIAGGLEGVNHGDTIRFGERYFLVCAVPEPTVVPEEKSE